MAQRRLKSLIRRQDGAVAVELALIMPVFFLLIFGIIEYSLVMFGTAVIESATSNTARLGKTGYTEEGLSREDMLHQMVEEKVGALLNPEHITITTQVYGNFESIHEPEPFFDQNGNGSRDSGESYDDLNGNGQWDADVGTAGVGGAGDVVVYTVNYPWKIHTPIIGEFLANEDGNFILRSSVVVRNEPYDSTVLGN